MATKLSKEIIELLSSDDSTKVLATVNEHGYPHAAAKPFIRVDDDGNGRVDLTGALRVLGNRGVARVFSEGGPTIGAALIQQRLADEVVLLTAQKPLGRPGRPALDARAMAALENGARYAEIETACLGVDTMRRLERLH